MPASTDRQAQLRRLPKVDDVLARALGPDGGANRFPRAVVVQAVRDAIAAARERILGDDAGDGNDDGAVVVDDETVLSDVYRRCEARMARSLRRVINATGIILHTNMGRAVLAEAAREAVAQATGYVNLEIDDASGKRSERLRHVETLLRDLTGAEAACVVNNNAAATMLMLRTVARGRECICARGQLVEIGGSFRMPDVMEASGCVLREVGATNKVHLRDYERAINDNTGAIVKVHPSNYRIVGFTSEVPVDELVRLGNKHGIPVCDDLGAGALVDLGPFSPEPEPLVRDSIEAGCALVCMSGDKLIGATQAGILIGKQAFVERAHSDPIYRALRCDKLTLAALEATLRLFLDREWLLAHNPTWRMLSMSLADLDEAARNLARAIYDYNSSAAARVIDAQSQLGSGSLPSQDLPTRAVAVTLAGVSAETLANLLRAHATPIHARVLNDEVVFDPRTLQAGDSDQIAAAFATISR